MLTLCESVGARLREKGLLCRGVELSIRNASDLNWRSQRLRLQYPTALTDELLDSACCLYSQCHVPGEALRSIGVRGLELVPDCTPVQMDLFTDYGAKDKLRRIDTALDKIRGKYGYGSIQRGAVFADRQLGGLNAREEHTVHPRGFIH